MTDEPFEMTPTAEERVLAAACLRGLSHGAFRLYVIFNAATAGKSAENTYFPVTLAGLMELHPGVGGKAIGITTLLKQLSELRGHRMLDIRGTLHRDEPTIPVVVKVLPPGQSVPQVAGVIDKQ